MIDKKLRNTAAMLGKRPEKAILHDLAARYGSRDLASGTAMAQSRRSEVQHLGNPG